MPLARATLISRIRRELDDEPWETRLTAAYTAGSGQVSVADPTQLSVGDVLEFPDGTQLRVTATPTGNPVSVKGGHNDTTDTSQANGAVALVNPEFAYHEIVEAIERTIEDLWPWVWVVRTGTLVAVQGQRYYPLSAASFPGFRELISVTQDITVNAGQYKVLRYGARGSGYPVAVVRDVPSSISANNLALFLPRVRTSPSATLHVTYAAEVSTAVSGGNYTDLEDGLMASMIVNGACYRLLQVAENVRLQDDVRQGDIGIQPGTRLRSAAYYREQYERQRERMNLRLVEAYPWAAEWAR